VAPGTTDGAGIPQEEFALLDTVANLPLLDTSFALCTSAELAASDDSEDRSSSPKYLKGSVQEEATTSGNEPSCAINAAPGTKFSSDGDAVRLDDGSILVVAHRTTSIELADAVVTVAAHTTACIQKRKNYSRVLDCTGVNSVVVKSGGSDIKLKGGDEVIISDSRLGTVHSLSDGLARRRCAAHLLSNGMVAITTEFHLPTFLKRSQHARDLRLATTKPEHKAFEAILKTAAALQYSTRAHGRYSWSGPSRSSSVSTTISLASAASK
jgi:hypothetical protein